MKKLALALLVYTGAINFCSAQQNNYLVNPGNGNGLRFWDSSDTYKIHMGTGSEYFYGPVNDYSLKTNMSSGTPGRGWTWGITGATPVAAINTLGNMQIAGTFQSNNLKAWAGNSYNSFVSTQLQFSWNGGGGNVSYAHAIKSRHNSASLTGNAIDFYLWQPGDNVNGEGSLNVMSLNGGYVGIGTNSPADQLEVVSSNRKIGFNTAISGVSNGGTISLSRNDDGMKTMYIGSSAAPADDNVIYSLGGGTELRFVSNGGQYASAGFGFYNNVSVQSAFGSSKPATPVMKIDGFGNVGIGTSSPGSYKLAVEGKIGAREVNVIATNPWPDYVFEKNYKLSSLEEIKNYIDQNQHLPEVPSAKEIEKNGVNVGEMNALLLKKVEELTLYVIELKKENSTSKEQMKIMQKSIDQLNNKEK